MPSQVIKQSSISRVNNISNKINFPRFLLLRHLRCLFFVDDNKLIRSRCVYAWVMWTGNFTTIVLLNYFVLLHVDNTKKMWMSEYLMNFTFISACCASFQSRTESRIFFSDVDLNFAWWYSWLLCKCTGEE